MESTMMELPAGTYYAVNLKNIKPEQMTKKENKRFLTALADAVSAAGDWWSPYDGGDAWLIQGQWIVQLRLSNPNVPEAVSANG